MLSGAKRINQIIMLNGTTLLIYCVSVESSFEVWFTLLDSHFLAKDLKSVGYSANINQALLNIKC